MRSSIKRLVFVLGAVSLANSPAWGQTATFDDLTSNSSVPNGYALPGSVWSNWIASSRADLYPAGKDACVISEASCAWNDNGSPAAISRGTTFDFNSGYFMSWADQNTGVTCNFACSMTLVVTGYNGATVVGTSTNILDPWNPQLLTFNFLNVDQVTFVTKAQQAWFLADNLVFTDSSAVPEPASVALLGTGLIGLYGAVRRRRNREV